MSKLLLFEDPPLKRPPQRFSSHHPAVLLRSLPAIPRHLIIMQKNMNCCCFVFCVLFTDTWCTSDESLISYPGIWLKIYFPKVRALLTDFFFWLTSWNIVLFDRVVFAYSWILFLLAFDSNYADFIFSQLYSFNNSLFVWLSWFVPGEKCISLFYCNICSCQIARSVHPVFYSRYPGLFDRWWGIGRHQAFYLVPSFLKYLVNMTTFSINAIWFPCY